MASVLPSKIAIITGSARGIGKAIASRLARDGFKVVLNDIPANQKLLDDAVKELKLSTKNSNIIGITADVSDRKQVESMVNQAIKDLNAPLGVMVANAGISLIKKIVDSTDEEIDLLFKVNFKGAINCYTAAAKVMIDQGEGGSIIGACSIAGHRGMDSLGVYCATKFALKGLTQSSALEWACHNIRVNTYCPGIVATDMWEKIDNDLNAMNNKPKGSAMESYSNTIPLGRNSRPQDMEGLVSFLASDNSAYITGQAINVDGGMVMN
ncbi:NAD(P)-binding protein [Nadsonia fulvescens var. elongata DSM 6958]|uniref:NAD(P)-binding protein n=1 Tax=Nadsonia fulvescens var. elongata DSM 6958 TaxID=857566 RepID=A0A1E3PJX9_9ASCO|nr:NAD(P)-binding protein [Nadsonia fulvescens var. elongata DSM 6958]